MLTTNTGAYQEMCALMRQFVTDPAMAAIIGYLPELRYADVNYAKLPEGNMLWLKFTMAEAGEKRRTLGRPSRITYSGVAGLQLFVPVTDKQAAERIRKVSDFMVNAFARSTTSVDFYKAGIKDMPPDNPWFYKRIYATYQYTKLEGS